MQNSFAQDFEGKISKILPLLSALQCHLTDIFTDTCMTILAPDNDSSRNRTSTSKMALIDVSKDQVSRLSLIFAQPFTSRVDPLMSSFPFISQNVVRFCTRSLNASLDNYNKVLKAASVNEVSSI